MVALLDYTGRSLVLVLLGKSRRCWKHLALPWRFPSSTLGAVEGSAGEAGGVVLEPCRSPCRGHWFPQHPRRSTSPCCWRWAHHLPHRKGGCVTHSCRRPHRCGGGCSAPVNHLLSLCLEPCTLNLLEVGCSASSGNGAVLGLSA